MDASAVPAKGRESHQAFCAAGVERCRDPTDYVEGQVCRPCDTTQNNLVPATRESRGSCTVCGGTAPACDACGADGQRPCTGDGVRPHWCAPAPITSPGCVSDHLRPMQAVHPARVLPATMMLDSAHRATRPHTTSNARPMRQPPALPAVPTARSPAQAQVRAALILALGCSRNNHRQP